METTIKPKIPVTFDLATVIKVVSLAVVITVSVFGIKASLADRISASEGDIKVLQNQYNNLTENLVAVQSSQVRQEEFLRTLLKDRGYVPEKILSNLKQP